MSALKGYFLTSVMWCGVYLALALLILGVVLLLVGCSTTAGVIDAMGKDPASACVNVVTPYGSIAVGRAAQPEVKVTVNGGTCVVEHGGK